MRKRTLEDYVELIYVLEADHSPVHTNDVALALQVNPASVTEMFQKLSDEGYLEYRRYAGVTLTDRGRKIAEKTLRRHDVLKEFLMLLGVEEQIANEDACRIEHVVHQETMQRLRKFVEFAHHKNARPRWLEHFQLFYSTGEYQCCTKQNGDARSKCNTK
jgi:DtxR family Mn-dependent transcriptional regulator